MYAHTYHTTWKPVALLIVFALFTLVLWPTLCRANGAEQEEDNVLENACKQDQAQSMSPMQESACYNYKYRLADRELSSIFQQAIDSIRKSSMSTELRDKWEKLLRKSQKAWIEYRKLNCSAIEYEWFGGSGMGAVKGSCFLRITKQRIDELRQRYLDQ